MEKMIRVYVKCQNALRNQKGQGMVEYGLILALVVVGALTILGTIGTGLEGTLTKVSDKINAASN